jgi:hypothetical protein
MYRPARSAVLGAAALAVLALAAACSDDGDGADASSVDLVSAIAFIDSTGFHDIDEAINDEGEVPPGAASDTRKAQAVVTLASWPADLQSEADALAQILDELATELEKEAPDLAAAGELATRAHDGQHDFSAAVWAHLRTEAGQEAESHD